MSPKRGEIWLVNLDSTIDAEIEKTRPAIVISSDVIGKLPLKLVVPLTDWKSAFISNLWHVCMEPSQDNELAKTSAADEKCGYSKVCAEDWCIVGSRSHRSCLSDRFNC